VDPVDGVLANRDDYIAPIKEITETACAAKGPYAFCFTTNSQRVVEAIVEPVLMVRYAMPDFWVSQDFLFHWRTSVSP